MLNSVAQNEWIRESLLDGHGNYLYCHDCIVAYIDVGTQRLARQRKIVQDRHQHTIVTKTKADIRESKLEKFVILPDDTATFEEWWESLDDDGEIQVRFPHEHHGLQGNRAKTRVMNDFLLFVDNNSTPNGRQHDNILFLTKIPQGRPSKAVRKGL